MIAGVTGGSGAIGRYVCDELEKAGHRVRCIDRSDPGTSVDFVDADLTDLNATRRALSGCEQVVHLAAIPDPFGNDGLETVMANNTVSSYCVFEAARLEGVERVIYGCSESSTGFGIHHVKIIPDYLPIDERHPVCPHESYSLSKHFGERIGFYYATAFGLEVISLRYTWVWTARAEASARSLAKAASEGTRPERIDGFGAWISVRDVAVAVRNSVHYQFPGVTSVNETHFEEFFLAARDTCIAMPTLDIVAEYCGSLPPVRDEGYFAANRYASVFDIRKAERLLGWTPTGHWRDIDTLEF